LIKKALKQYSNASHTEQLCHHLIDMVHKLQITEAAQQARDEKKQNYKNYQNVSFRFTTSGGQKYQVIKLLLSQYEYLHTLQHV